MLATVIAFVWYYQGVKHLGAARTAVFTNFILVFGVLLDALILENPITLSLLLGITLVIGGVMLTIRGRV